jgi:hypothetical protein
MTWRKTSGPTAASAALPTQLAQVMQDSLSEVPNEHWQSLGKLKKQTERVSFAGFTILLCTIAMQVNVSITCCKQSCCWHTEQLFSN